MSQGEQRLGNPDPVFPEFSSEFARISHAVGKIDRLAYILSLDLLLEARPFFHWGYPESWIKHYVDDRRFENDPVLAYARRSGLSFDWNEIDWNEPSVRTFAEEMMSFGLSVTGFAVPIPMSNGGQVLVSFGSDMSTDDWTSFLSGHRIELELFAHHFHSRQIVRRNEERIAEAFNITPREREVMLWVANGKTSAVVSQILGISERTVRAHLDSAGRKMGVVNRTHLVAKGIAFGFIRLLD